VALCEVRRYRLYQRGRRRLAIAKVHAKSGAFSGYTAVGELLPPIPAGVAVTLAPAANETLTISTKQSAELDSGLKLGPRARRSSATRRSTF
jgi:hypothetical protein